MKTEFRIPLPSANVCPEMKKKSQSLSEYFIRFQIAGALCPSAPQVRGLEVEVQSELNDAILIERRAADCSKSSGVLRAGGGKIAYRRVPNRFCELRMVREIKDRRFKCQFGLFSDWNFEIFLEIEVEIVNAWVTNVCIEPRRIAKCFGNVAAAERRRGSRIDQSRSRAGPGEVRCLVVEPEIHASIRPGNRSWVANYVRPVR